jgi:cell division protein FtsI (penicillin-binding protein 3)
MTMRMMMEGVVLRGTAHLTARLDGYTSAGKTGTAQIFDTRTHHYTHLYNASVMGFTPVTNPRLVILVTVNGTAGDAGMGAAAAAPVFKTIATEALRMLDVPKDIPQEPVATAKPAKPEKPVDDDVSIADLGGPSIMDEDPSVKQLLADQMKPPAHADEDQDEIPPAPAPLLFAGPVVPDLVPDFRGKSIRDVMETASSDGIEVMIEGSGLARAQLPLPGQPLRRGERIRIVFAR